MGITPFPAELIVTLARAYGATAFVETGTFHGTTTAWAARQFDVVHTIEIGAHRHNVASHTLAHLKNVVCHCGDSQQVLPEIVRQLIGYRVVYYLDGHWSGEGTDGEQDQCPLLGELACLSNEDIIIIDDARIFMQGARAFPPLNPVQWPSFVDVVGAIPSKLFVRVIDDAIFAVPNRLQELL